MGADPANPVFLVRGALMVITLGAFLVLVARRRAEELEPLLCE